MRCCYQVSQCDYPNSRGSVILTLTLAMFYYSCSPVYAGGMSARSACPGGSGNRVIILLFTCTVAGGGRSVRSASPGRSGNHVLIILLTCVAGGGRSVRSACPGGSGNYGFNSFNFMTFMLLVFR